MDVFLDALAKEQLEEIRKSESIEKATSASKPENVNISKEFLVILNLSSQIVADCEGEKNEMKKMKNVINNVEDRMQKLFQKVITSTDTNFDDIVALAISYKNVGMTRIFDMEKLAVAEAHLLKCLQLLDGKELDRKAILPAMEALLDLDELYDKWHQEEKCFPVLDKAIELFSKYTNDEDEYPDPVNILAAANILDSANPNLIYKRQKGFQKYESPKILLTNFHMSALNNIVDFYQAQQSDKHRFVKSVHNMLSKKIADTIMSQSVDCLYWADTSIALSLYFIYNHRLTEARNHIVAAEYMMDIFDKNLSKTMSQVQFGKNLKRRRKNIGLFTVLYKRYKKSVKTITECFGVYEFMQLHLTRDRLLDGLQIEDDKLCEADNSRLECGLEPQEELTKFLIFSDLEKDLESFNTQLVEKLDMSKEDDVKKISAYIRRHLSDSEELCVTSDGSTFYTESLIKLKAYIYLTKLEGNKDELISFCKLRIDALKTFIEEEETDNLINAKLILALSEIIIAYCSLLDEKTDNLLLNGEQLNEASREEMLSKINFSEIIDILIRLKL